MSQMNDAESATKDRQIQDLQLRLREAELELVKLQKTVAQQQATIHTQSLAIQNPRPGHATPYCLTRGHRTHNTALKADPRPPPPVFGLGLTTDTPKPAADPPSIFGGHLQRAGETPGPRASIPAPSSWNSPDTYQSRDHPSRLINVNEFGSPERLKHPDPSTSPHPYPEPNVSEGVSAPASLPPHSTFTGSQQPDKPTTNRPLRLIKPSENNVPGHVAEAFQKVFRMTQQYAFAHVNNPSTAKDNALPRAIKDRLLKAASHSTAFPLMSTSHTRYLLVAKVISQWLVNFVLKTDTFAGFSEEVDGVIEINRSLIYQSTPAELRYIYLNIIAAQIGRLQKMPDWEVKFHRLCKQRGNELWGILKPMMHIKTACDWDDLYALMIEAHQLAALMYSGAEEYQFVFPVIGTRFDKTIMASKDIAFSHFTSEELEARAAMVKLCITPQVLVRINTQAGTVNSSTLVQACVLLQLGNASPLNGTEMCQT